MAGHCLMDTLTRTWTFPPSDEHRFPHKVLEKEKHSLFFKDALSNTVAAVSESVRDTVTEGGGSVHLAIVFEKHLIV